MLSVWMKDTITRVSIWEISFRIVVFFIQGKSINFMHNDIVYLLINSRRRVLVFCYISGVS